MWLIIKQTVHDTSHNIFPVILFVLSCNLYAQSITPQQAILFTKNYTRNTGHKGTAWYTRAPWTHTYSTFPNLDSSFHLLPCFACRRNSGTCKKSTRTHRRRVQLHMVFNRAWERCRCDASPHHAPPGCPLHRGLDKNDFVLLSVVNRAQKTDRQNK